MLTQIMTRRGRGETVISKDRGTEMVGLRRWTDEYARRYVPPHELEETVAHAIAEYKQRLEDEKRKAKALEEPDEDGWVTVTKHRCVNIDTWRSGLFISTLCVLFSLNIECIL